MSAIVNEIVAMPHSTMWWPIIIGGLWGIWMLWPRVDGGGVPFGGYANVLPAWFTLGPIVFVWVAWAILVALSGLRP